MRFLAILGLVLTLAACVRSDDSASGSAHVRGLYVGGGAGANALVH